MTKKHSLVKQGFSLVELIIIIVVLVIIVAVGIFALKPVLRERALTAACVNNLKQIGTAEALYLSTYNNFLPPPTGAFSIYTNAANPVNGNEDNIPWYVMYSELGPHSAIKSGVIIGSQNLTYYGKKATIFCPSTVKDYWEYSSYAYNLALFQGAKRNVKDLSKPAAVATVMDHSGKPSFMVAGRGALGEWHNGKSNVLYLDGHVADIEKKTLNNEDLWLREGF